MKSYLKWRAYLPLMIGSVAVILFSTAGIASMMGWRPGSSGSTDGSVAHKSVAATGKVPTPKVQTALSEAKARVHRRCAECGQVVSMTEITANEVSLDMAQEGSTTDSNEIDKEVNSVTRHNVVVRMTDGSIRVLNNVSAADWRVGERVIVIAGTTPRHK